MHDDDYHSSSSWSSTDSHSFYDHSSDDSIFEKSFSERMMDEDGFMETYRRSDINEMDGYAYPSDDRKYREFGWGPSYFAVFMIVLTLWMRHAL
jgi:hypothetical protein